MCAGVRLVRVCLGPDPLIMAWTWYYLMYIFGPEGQLILSGISNGEVGMIGDVGGYVTFMGDTLRTYQITRRPGCAIPGPS